MIEKFIITNENNETLELILSEPTKSGIIVASVTGLGPVNANINTMELATSDGSIFNSARTEQRNIVFTFIFEESTAAETIEDIRHKVYRFFPSKGEVEINVVSTSRNVKTTGYVESNEVPIFAEQESATVSIICPSSFFEDMVTESVLFYGVQKMFHFPISNPSTTEKQIILGIIQNQTVSNIPYRGEHSTGLKFNIICNGPVENILIYSLDTRETITIHTDKIAALTGQGLVAGDKVVLNTIKGQKGITLYRGGSEINILNALSKNVPWFQLKNGDNYYGFTASAGITNVEFYTENSVLYGGV